MDKVNHLWVVECRSRPIGWKYIFAMGENWSEWYPVRAFTTRKKARETKGEIASETTLGGILGPFEEHEFRISKYIRA